MGKGFQSGKRSSYCTSTSFSVFQGGFFCCDLRSTLFMNHLLFTITILFMFGFGAITSFCKRSTFRSIISVRSMASHHHHPHSSAVRKVLVPIADGSEEMEAVTVIDTLVRAGAEVRVASVTGNIHVVCSRGVKLSADCLIQDCVSDNFDAIVCPGGMPGAQHLCESVELQQLLKQQVAHNKLTAAICAAPAVVLAQLHLIRDRSATCYPAEKFMSKLAHYSTEPVVWDGNLITSQGPGTALPFSLKIVEALYGEEKVSQLQREMVIS